MRLRTRLWLGGLAAGGVAAAHLVAFFLVAPDPSQRAELLEATGHGAWPFLVSLALGAMVAGLAGFAVGRIREGDAPPRNLYRGTLGRLLALQVLGFVLLEALERLAHHRGDLLGFLGEPVVLIGLVLAAATAAVGAALIVLFAGLIDRLVVLLRVLPRAPRALAPAGLAIFSPSRLRIVLGSMSPRGPPQPAR
ncbi:MAG: hypothetical protein ACRDHB_08315 [Actinomycetota bacterium]